MVTPIIPAQRIDLNLPVIFRLAGSMVAGRTLNVSESGMLARFDTPVELWLVGELVMTVGAYYIQIEARVARTLDDGYGLSFLINDENDRRVVRILNDYALSVASGVPMRQSRAY